MENDSKDKRENVWDAKAVRKAARKHCISMVESNEGFWYPSVDEKSCIECKLCLKKMSGGEYRISSEQPQKVWAWRNKNDTDIMRSASGGAADSAAKTVFCKRVVWSMVLLMMNSWQ